LRVGCDYVLRALEDGSSNLRIGVVRTVDSGAHGTRKGDKVGSELVRRNLDVASALDDEVVLSVCFDDQVVLG